MRLPLRATPTFLAPFAVLLALAHCGHGGSGPNGGGPGGGGGTGGAAGSDGGLGVLADGAVIPTPVPVTGHPRLFLTQKDLPRLQAWANPSNPFYAKGLAKVAGDFKKLMDTGPVPGAHDCADSSGFLICELLMENFALMSLVDPDVAEREDYAARAKKLLMNVIDTASLGIDNNDPNPIRHSDFSTRDRSRNGGRAFGLTVDWLYARFSSAEKEKIRQVFLRWADEDVHAQITTDNHPEPVGVMNDPVLLKDPIAVRFAGNNYFCGHGRNLGMMAMAFDPADDPDGKLRAYLDNATGAFLYMSDALLRGDAKGGILPEGYEYSPLSMGYVADFLWALHTAGLDDPAKRGLQVSMAANPFWHDVIAGYMHKYAPGLNPNKANSYTGPYHDFPSFGDLDVYEPYSGVLGDPIEGFGAVGAIARDTGDTALYDAVRWIEWNMPPGGPAADKVASRIGSSYASRNTLEYFLLMDPAANQGTDPTPGLSLDYYSPGLRFLFARTGWGQADSYFTYQLTWTGMDHRHADANHFGLYRKGEWLTKERSGYGLFVSALHNTLSIQNDKPRHTDALPTLVWQTGSSFTYTAAGDGAVLAKSVGADYAYALGDATELYNSTFENATDVKHASRSIVWLKPDVVVVYDRATTGQAGRFKRFYLQLPNTPQIQGQTATSKTAGQQQVFLTALLPSGAAIVSDPAPDKPAGGDPMNARVHVETTDTDARFLNVVEGADAGASASPVSLVTSASGTAYAGAVVHGTAVLFPVALGPFTGVSFTAPGGTTKFVVTGLTPGATYDVANSGGSVTVMPGSSKKADAGGVLEF